MEGLRKLHPGYAQRLDVLPASSRYDKPDKRSADFHVALRRLGYRCSLDGFDGERFFEIAINDEGQFRWDFAAARIMSQPKNSQLRTSLFQSLYLQTFCVRGQQTELRHQ